jgi:hypothetical protein|eukprot:COSAG01_NODE_4505_length_4961_cov_5.384805_8_plen_57_part_00
MMRLTPASPPVLLLLLAATSALTSALPSTVGLRSPPNLLFTLIDDLVRRRPSFPLL